ncbi:hypothetical protein CANCADRAFT_19053, partial [Tortispora caseinolytica NRRL Y-17796]
YLLEYSVSSSVPDVHWNTDLKHDPDNEYQVPDDLRLEDVPPSGFIAEKGMTEVFNENIEEMVNIRKVCAKIQAIRSIQMGTVNRDSRQAYDPEPVTNKDLDLDSRLDPKSEFMSEEVCYSALRRAIGRIGMVVGFETASPQAVDALTSIAARHLENLGHCIMTYSEEAEAGRQKYSDKEAILHSLFDNGIDGIWGLNSHCNHSLKFGDRLKDITRRMKEQLAEQLRPAIAELDEQNFADGSEQFVSGNFTEDLGDDFYGFKELGLDKEFGLMSLNVPLHLLHGRITQMAMQEGTDVEPSVREKEFAQPAYDPITKSLVEDSMIGLLKPFFISAIEK